VSKVIHTNLCHDFCKVVGMPAKLEEANIAHCTRLLAWPLLETVLLGIRNGLKSKGQDKDDNSDDIRCLAERWLRHSNYIWTVENRYWERDGPDPQHLEDPETKEGKKLVTLVVKAIVFARLQDTEEQESRKTSSPEHDEDGRDYLPRMSGASHGECDDGQPDEVGASHEVGDLVEFASECDGETYQLICDGDEKGDSQVVVVQHVDGRMCRHGWC
jgi:hypothetical protein